MKVTGFSEFAKEKVTCIPAALDNIKLTLNLSGYGLLFNAEYFWIFFHCLQAYHFECSLPLKIFSFRLDIT